MGGAIGSNLQQETCAKKSGAINPDCKAASMLLHLKPESTAYLENVWAWHFRAGIFPDDPTFSECKADDGRCSSSWALRVIDSTAIYVLGAGLYSWFSGHIQACLETNDCQQRGVEIQQSSDLWIYNLGTKAIIEMVTPTGGITTLAQDNMNGFLSSILAWLEGAEETSGRRHFPGFPVYTLHGLRNQILPDPCKTALTAKILCDYWVQSFTEPAYHGSLGNASLTDSICDESCGESLRSWFDNVNANCEGYTVAGDILTLYGGRMWAGYNGTCLTDPETGRYCNGMNFSLPLLIRPILTRKQTSSPNSPLSAASTTCPRTKCAPTATSTASP